MEIDEHLQAFGIVKAFTGRFNGILMHFHGVFLIQFGIGWRFSVRHFFFTIYR